METTDILSHLPSWDQIFRIVPMLIVFMGVAYVGWLARGETVQTLREWLRHMRDKNDK